MLYEYAGNVYLNLTNRCPVACRFCVKQEWDMRFRGADLRLEREPGLDELLRALEERLERGGVGEAVFCGFGEATYRLDLIVAVGMWLRRRREKVRARLNTVGLGSLIRGRDITGELSRCLDAVSVSLNTADPAQWVELHRPAPAYRDAGFESVLRFVEGCVAAGLDTCVTAVEQPGVDLAAVERLARRLGAGFRARPRLD